MNAGKAPPAVTGPIRRPANFESTSRLAVSLRRAMRGKGDSSARRVCNFLASTRAAPVSSSAHCRAHGSVPCSAGNAGSATDAKSESTLPCTSPKPGPGRWRAESRRCVCSATASPRVCGLPGTTAAHCRNWANSIVRRGDARTRSGRSLCRQTHSPRRGGRARKAIAGRVGAGRLLAVESDRPATSAGTAPSGRGCRTNHRVSRLFVRLPQGDDSGVNHFRCGGPALAA